VNGRWSIAGLTPLLAADAALRDLLTRYHTPWLDTVMWTFSAIGSAGAVWLCIAAIMAVWAPRLRPAAWQVVLALLLAQLAVDGLVKPLVGRPRPFVARPTITVVGSYRPDTFSFPSGHAAQSFAAAVVLASAMPRRRFWWFALAVLIACSRVFIGVHYPLDVAIGTLVGLGVGTVVTGGRAWYSDGLSVAPHAVPR
jgi:undecaprenyl-diphosphatase